MQEYRSRSLLWPMHRLVQWRLLEWMREITPSYIPLWKTSDKIVKETNGIDMLILIYCSSIEQISKCLHGCIYFSSKLFIWYFNNTSYDIVGIVQRTFDSDSSGYGKVCSAFIIGVVSRGLLPLWLSLGSTSHPASDIWPTWRDCAMNTCNRITQQTMSWF